MDKRDLLINTAKQYIGVRESGGDNSGPQVEAFQKALGGPAVHQAWCMDFVHYCAKKVDQNIGGEPYELYKSQSVVEVWNNTNPLLRLSSPEPGCVVLWEHFQNGVATGLGHAGIVIQVKLPNQIVTVEGNTSDGSGINRDGDGVYSRLRPIVPPSTSSMKLLGFLKPWALPEDLLRLKSVEEKLKGIEDEL